MTTQYDAMRRPTDKQQRNGAATATPLAVTHFDYDADGHALDEKHASALDVSGNPTAWAVTATAYSPSGKPIQVTDPTGFVTQTDYDALDRPTCVAVRMNPSVYAALAATPLSGTTSSRLPLSACTLSTAGSFGHDRISRTNYDAAGETASLVRALGDPLLQQTYETFAYAPDGEQASVADAIGNTTSYAYDGFNRMNRTLFPSTAPGAGTSDSLDVESYGYDENGNRTSLTKRDGTVLAYGYDALNRETSKTVPAAGGQPAYTVNTGYDLAGRTLKAQFGTTGMSVVYGYDAAGRMIGEATNGQQLTFAYDGSSNRTRITWPDAFHADYAYDALGRVTGITTSAGDTIVSSFAYDPLSRRTAMTRGNGLATAYQYDAAGRLTCLARSCTASPPTGLAFSYAYSPASQTLARTTSSDVLTWSNYPANASKTYDGLNRDASLAALGTQLPCRGSGGYDCNGNVLAGGAAQYGYDQENRLVGAATPSPGPTEALNYDPLGRLRTTVVTGGATTQFLYDGDRLVGEYDGSGALLRRYIHGPDADEPLASYESGALGWLHADRQGSIVARSNAAGSINATYAYGEPQTWGGARFAYTGQIELPEAQLYYYKARVYDPVTGRFAQTDPVGYLSDVDLYAYGDEDPTDKSDPSGTESYLVFRSVLGVGNHPFIVVTNPDRSVRARFSYGPQTNDNFHPGKLVEVQGDLKSRTAQDDRITAHNGAGLTESIDLNKRGFTDDAIISSGQAV
ncbi:MAG TPA: RHS repeat-associated core domain-containing protein, partial [Caulobacteraceae bacterium]